MRSVASSIYTNKTYQSTSLITSIVSNLSYLNFTGTNTVLFCVRRHLASVVLGFFFALCYNYCVSLCFMLGRQSECGTSVSRKCVSLKSR